MKTLKLENINEFIDALFPKEIDISFLLDNSESLYNIIEFCPILISFLTMQDLLRLKQKIQILLKLLIIQLGHGLYKISILILLLKIWKTVLWRKQILQVWSVFWM